MNDYKFVLDYVVVLVLLIMSVVFSSSAPLASAPGSSLMNSQILSGAILSGTRTLVSYTPTTKQKLTNPGDTFRAILSGSSNSNTNNKKVQWVFAGLTVTAFNTQVVAAWSGAPWTIIVEITRVDATDISASSLCFIDGSLGGTSGAIQNQLSSVVGVNNLDTDNQTFLFQAVTTVNGDIITSGSPFNMLRYR